MTGPWISGESLSPSRLNLHAGAATLVTGFSTDTIQGQSGLTVDVISDLSVQNTAAAQRLELGGAPSNTSGLLSLRANSAQSDYLFLQDATGAKSNFLLGLRTGDSNASLVDGLNLYDLSHGTMIARFSSDSVRFYPPIVAPLFDTGGALSSTYNAALFLRGGSKESQVQAAITAAVGDGVSRVYVPANLYPYNAAVISFSTLVQMVREGGDWSVYDVQAYGAFSSLTVPDAWSTAAIQAALTATANTGKVVFIPAGTYGVTGLSFYSANILRGAGFGQGGTSQLYQGSANTTMLRPAVPGSTTKFFSIEDLQLSSFGNVGNNGILDCVNCARFAVRRVTFSGASKTAVRVTGGVSSGDAGFGTLDECQFTTTQAGGTDVLLQSTASDQPDGMTIFNCFFNSDYTWIGSVATVGGGSTSLIVMGSRFETTATNVSAFSGAIGASQFIGNRFETTGGGATLRITVRPTTGGGTTPCAAFLGNTWAAPGGIVFTDTGFSKSIRWGENETGPILRNELQDGTAINPAWSFRSESSLGIYRSADSAIGLSYGQLQLPSANSLQPSLAFSSESSLGWYRSAASSMELSYGSLVVPEGSTILLRGATSTGVRMFEAGDVGYITFNRKPSFAQDNTGLASWTLESNYNTTGKFTFTHNNPGAGGVNVFSIDSGGNTLAGAGTAIIPGAAFMSETSLGWYRSGVSTMALSYGSLNLNQARLVSVRTAASLDSTSLSTNEMAFQIVAGSVATLAIRSGGTIYYFASSASTKG